MGFGSLTPSRQTALLILKAPSCEVFLRYTAILRKVVGRSACDNPKRYCGWFWVHSSSKKFERTGRETMDICLRTTIVVSGTVYWLHPILPFRIVMCTIFPTIFLEIALHVHVYALHCMSQMQQLYITGALKGHHLKGVYSPQGLYFPLTTLSAHPRWGLPVKCFTPMVSKNENTLKSMKGLLGDCSSRYLLFISCSTICFWIYWVWVYKIKGLDHCQRAKTCQK